MVLQTRRLIVIWGLFFSPPPPLWYMDDGPDLISLILLLSFPLFKPPARRYRCFQFSRLFYIFVLGQFHVYDPVFSLLCMGIK